MYQCRGVLTNIAMKHCLPTLAKEEKAIENLENFKFSRLLVHSVTWTPTWNSSPEGWRNIERYFYKGFKKF
jgi:hypothetical protein